MFNFHCEHSSLIKDRVSQLYSVSEQQYITNLIKMLEGIEVDDYTQLNLMLDSIINSINQKQLDKLDLLVKRFNLSNNEIVALLCLGESLLLIPDHYTQNLLITDTISCINWANHNVQGIGNKIAKWSLIIGKQTLFVSRQQLLSYLMTPLNNFGSRIIILIIKLILSLLNKKFMIGSNTHKAIHNNKSTDKLNFSYHIAYKRSYTQKESDQAFANCVNALHTLSYVNKYNSIRNNSISLTLSSLFHKYNFRHIKDIRNIVVSRLTTIFRIAKKHNITVFIESEFSDNIDIFLELIEILLSTNIVKGYKGCGIVVDVSQKRSVAIIDYLIHYAHRFKTKLFIKLSLGQYWHQEIIKAQLLNLPGYPVFTQLEYIDIAYLNCALKILDHIDDIRVGFEIYNPMFIPLLYHLFKNKPIEFHFSYGVFNQIPLLLYNEYNIKCRIFGHIGTIKDLLPNLLNDQLNLESKFNLHTVNADQDYANFLNNIISQAKHYLANNNIVNPSQCYGQDFCRAQNINLASSIVLRDTQNVLNTVNKNIYNVKSCILNEAGNSNSLFHQLDIEFYSIDGTQQLSYIQFASDLIIKQALSNASNKDWLVYSKKQRIDCLHAFCDFIENNYCEIITILYKETGKSIFDSLQELRDALDVARLYILQYNKNPYHYSPLGLIIGIGTWSYPVLSLMNAVIAALVMNNPIVFKPSRYASTISWFLFQFLYKAGIPKSILQLIIGYGNSISTHLLADDRVKGVIFDGSLEAAINVNYTVANKLEPVRFIAHTTNSISMMILDSSVFLKQALVDACQSSFSYNGQNPDSLKFIYIQDQIFETAVDLLTNIIKNLKLGSQYDISNELGEVINKKAKSKILSKINYEQQSQGLFKNDINANHEKEDHNFIAPTLIIVQSLTDLGEKINGPVLYIAKFYMNKVKDIAKEIKSYQNISSLVVYSNINKIHNLFINNIVVSNITINAQTIGNITTNPIGLSVIGYAGCKKASPNFIYQLTSDQVVINQIHTLRQHQEQNKLIKDRVLILKNFLQAIKRNLKQLKIDEVQYQSFCDLFNHLQDNCLLSQEIILPTIAVQQSVIRFYPIGNIGLFANDIVGYITQVFYAVMSGNNIILYRNPISLKLKFLLSAKVFTYCYSLIDYYQMDLVLFENNYDRILDIKMNFSQRSNLLALSYQNLDGSYSQLSLVKEVTIFKNNCYY